MTPEQDEFAALRRLLKLKRYEQPPPGYFNDFSRQVLARVRVDKREGSEQLLDRVTWEAPWLQRLLEAFQLKPVMAVAFGAVICALLVGGVLLSETAEYTHVPPLPIMADQAVVQTASPGDNPLGLGAPPPGMLSLAGTNREMNLFPPAGGSLFDQFRLNAQPVSFDSRSGGQ